jgi:3-phenylpropionate/trans-cinnamate dioxygenase ferredoxin reductase component
MPRTVLVIGAGLAGARCAEALRAGGFGGRVVLVGAESIPPYERPTLSKEFLGNAREAADILLRPRAFWSEHQIELVLDTRIDAIDVAARTAISTSGKVFSWDALVLATGALARRFPRPAPRGVHVLRSLGDALALREKLRCGGRLVIVGAGFVGTEVASTATARGVDVVLVEAGPGPLGRVLGPEVSALLADRYRAHGVELRVGASVGGFLSDRAGRLRAVKLADGESVACDVALVALGAIPEPPPIPGLRAEGGVATDACGRTTIRSVYACGDLANTWRPALGARLRIEHWTNAASQGAAVARAILGREEQRDDLPYFWSDQFGLRLQYVGHAQEWATVDLDDDGDSFSAIYRSADGRPLAALLANRPGDVGALRRELVVERAAA